MYRRELWCFYSTDLICDQIIFKSTCTSDIVTVSVLLLAKSWGGGGGGGQGPPAPPSRNYPPDYVYLLACVCHIVLVYLLVYVYLLAFVSLCVLVDLLVGCVMVLLGT